MHAVPFTLLLAASSSVAQVGFSRVATAAQAAPSARASAERALPRDRAANLVGGVWQCDTIAGNTGTHTYAENEDDGSIDVSIELQAGFRSFHIRENYRYDDARKLWTARTQGDAYVGTAQPWTGYKWTFEGTTQERGERRAVRMVYFDLADQAFRRDFQAKQDGAWKTYSAETCRRPSN